MTKRAIGNLVSRYRAVLRKCHLMNTFGSLAVAAMLLGGTCSTASAQDYTETITGAETAYDAIKEGTDGNYTYTFQDGDTIVVKGPYGVGGRHAIEMGDNANSITIKNNINIRASEDKHTTLSGIEFKKDGKVLNMDNVSIDVFSKDSTISQFAIAHGIDLAARKNNTIAIKDFNVNIKMVDPEKGARGYGIYAVGADNTITLGDTKIVTDVSSNHDVQGTEAHGILLSGDRQTLTTGKVDINVSGEGLKSAYSDGVLAQGQGPHSITLGEGNISSFAKSANAASARGISIATVDGGLISKGDGAITATAESSQGSTYSIGVWSNGSDSNVELGNVDVTAKAIGGSSAQAHGLRASTEASISMANGSITASADTEGATVRGAQAIYGAHVALGTEESTVTVKAFGNDKATALYVDGNSDSRMTLKGNVSVEAPIAVAGRQGTITNAGNLTVTSGTVSDFTATFIQEKGNTTLNGPDFFGGNVHVQKGALTVAMPDRGGVALNSNEAMVALGQRITLGEQARLTVGDTANSGTTVSFGDNSLLVVEGTKAASSFMIAAPETAPGTISVSKGSSLYILNAKIGETYKITEGFVAKEGDVTGWTGDNLVTGRMINAIRSDGTDGKIIVTTELKSSSEVFPGVSIPNTIDEIFISGENDVNSDNPGVAFISRALEPLYLSESDVVSTLDSAAQISVAGGVQASTFAVGLAPTRAIQDHLSLVTNLAQKGTSLHGEGFDVWMNVLYGSNHTHNRSAGSLDYGHNMNFYGVILGSDCTFGLGSGQAHVGLALNVGSGQTKSNGDFNRTRNDFDFWGVSLYGGWNLDNFNIIADLGYSASINELEQRIPSSLNMGSHIEADVNSSIITAGLKGEYKIETSGVDIVPHVGVRYVGMRTDDFTTKLDRGDLFHTESDFQNIWQFPVGVNLSKSFETESGWKVKPMVDLAIVPTVGDTKANIDVHVPGVNASDSISRRVLDSTAFDGTLGLALQKDNVSFGLNYNIQASEHTTGHGVMAQFMYQF